MKGNQADNDDIFAPYNWISPNNVWDRPMLATIVEEYHNLLKIHVKQDRYVKDLCIKFQLYVRKYRPKLLADMNLYEVMDKIAIVNMILKIKKEDLPQNLFY